ncbi:MAG: LytTR family transcriptional regulator DNA-binding domain-containing protein [Prevotellaceae bacterium]|nr:LytTR family transcriptional regulator DNA-binding domain-containing protein [Candidatus Colivivens caballi]
MSTYLVQDRFVRIIWVGEHTDSMSAIKKCQYWQIFNVELIIYGKKHYLRTVKSCQYWQKYNASNGDKERPVSTSLKFSNTTFLPFNTFFSDFQDYAKTISDFIVQCHRGFLVNLEYVESMEGSNGRLFLNMFYSEKKIPVSRANKITIKETLSIMQCK